MNCKKCKKEIPDDSKFCPHCGEDQIYPGSKSGVLIIDCTHCGATGECKKGKTLEKIHSCEYCISKSDFKSNNPFQVVPCAYCGGKGKHVIDLKAEKLQQQKRQQGGNKNA